MLRELRVTGSAVIEDIDLDLGDGLTVLTGETGTGKTTVLTALTLLSGGKAAGNAVEPEQGTLAVEGVWDGVPDAVAARAVEAGGALDDGELLVRRTVAAQGRSRAVIGGASVPASVLTDVGEELVALHGQSDQLLLRRPSLQREVLDRFAGPEHLDAVRAFGATFGTVQQIQDRLDALATQGEVRRRDREEARIGVEIIDVVDPRPGEDADLKQEALRLQNVDTLHESAAGALRSLTGDEALDSSEGSASQAVGRARRFLAGGIAHDESLSALQIRMDEVAVLVDDVATDLRTYLDGLDADPARLEQVQQRRGRLSEIARRFGGASASLDAALEWRDRARELLAEPDDQAQIEGLAAELEHLRAQLDVGSRVLSMTRHRVAAELGNAVTKELQSLAMPRAAFEIAVQASPIGPSGCDEIVFQLIARPDAPAVPVHKGASGGELSRVMLALEVVLAGADPVGTFVFDEVDAGVGGRAAVDVGRRLAALGRTRQVIVVTHLPQVAAFADHHVLVERTDGAARASLRPLDAGERVSELTRMLAGLEESEAGRAHAEELLETAASLKGRATR